MNDLQWRYANIVTPDFNNIEEQQVRCEGCAHPMWAEENAGGEDEMYCAICVANSCAGCLELMEPLEAAGAHTNIDGERFCVTCATEMNREFAAAMAR